MARFKAGDIIKVTNVYKHSWHIMVMDLNLDHDEYTLLYLESGQQYTEWCKDIDLYDYIELVG